MIKADLGYFSQPIPFDVEAYLLKLIDDAELELRAYNSITLVPGRLPDLRLAAEYASWLYRKRATGEGKSPMLLADIRAHQRFPAEVNNDI